MSSEPPAIKIVEYDPRWPSIFQDLSTPVWNALGRLAVAIEHVGSTAVPGLAAKPIIDIDVVIPSLCNLPAAVASLAALGYTHQGDLGITGREAFVAPVSNPEHHLYICAVDGEELRRHSLFRDLLRADSELAARYAALKRDAARRFTNDRTGYTTAKSGFIEELLRNAESARNTKGL